MTRKAGKRGPGIQEKDTLKPTGFMDQIIWELEAPPHLRKNEDRIAEMRQYLHLRGASIHLIYTPQVNHEICYVVTSAKREAIKSLFTQVRRKDVILKRTNAQVDEKCRSSILETPYKKLLKDIMWEQEIDKQLLKEHRFIYLIHDGKDVFYVGQSLAPKSRFGSRFFSIRNTNRLKKDDYVTEFIYNNLPDSKNWFISFISLDKCEDLLLKTCMLPTKNKEYEQQILAQFRLYQSFTIECWLQSQSKQDTFPFIEDSPKNKSIPSNLKWSLNVIEQAMISVYQPHFNIANNLYPRPLPTIYKKYCNDTLPCSACQRRAKPSSKPFSDEPSQIVHPYVVD